MSEDDAISPPPAEWLTPDPFADADELPEGIYSFDGEAPTRWTVLW